MQELIEKYKNLYPGIETMDYVLLVHFKDSYEFLINTDKDFIKYLEILIKEKTDHV